MNGPTRQRRPEIDALQARFALRVAARLSENAERLPHDIAERLRLSRDQALARAVQVRRAAESAATAFHVGPGAAALGAPTPWWLRFASFTPLVLLVAGLVLIQHLHLQAEIHAAAEVDAALLADDLPPEAYRDPGFVVFLKQPEP